MRFIDSMTPEEIDILKLKGMLPEKSWPTVEEQEAYWSLRDDGRNPDGTGESYAERNL